MHSRFNGFLNRERFMKLLLFLLLAAATANAGLPPTTTKAVGDTSFITTFSFEFPNFTVTRTGTKTTFNVLSEAGGGTNQSTYAQGNILYASAANTLSKLPIGTSGAVLTSNGTVPVWNLSSFTNPTTASGSMLYAGSVVNGSGVLAQLAIGSTGQVMAVSSSGFPYWASHPGTASYNHSYFDDTCVFSVTNTGYTIFADDATCNFGTRIFDNITCTTTGSVSPKFVCTLPYAGVYRICLNGIIQTGSAASGAGIALSADNGSTYIVEQTLGGSTVPSPFGMCGTYKATTTSVTFGLYGRASTGSLNLTRNAAGGGSSVVEMDIQALTRN
jgi:hypothetical protein